jgi:hypothetical protein
MDDCFPPTLTELPDEILHHIALSADSAATVGRLAATSRRFGLRLPGASEGDLSIAEEALRCATRHINNQGGCHAALCSTPDVCSPARCSALPFALSSARTRARASMGAEANEKIQQRTIGAYRKGIWFPGSFGPMAQRCEARSNPTRIDIKTVADEDGSEVFFRCRVYTMLGKLQAAYCQNRGYPEDGERLLHQQHVRFYYRGMLIKWDDTPASLNMQEELAVIDVITLPFARWRHPATLRRGLSDIHKVRLTEVEPRMLGEATEAAPAEATEGTPHTPHVD